MKEALKTFVGYFLYLPRQIICKVSSMEDIKDIKKLGSDASCIKNAMLQGKNIDILLYLAKYNPNVTLKDIAKNFGKDSLQGIKWLEECKLVREESEVLALTNEGIFQLEGLMSLVV